MICKNCGKEIDSDSKFCEFCGETINLEINAEHQKTSKKDVGKNSKSKRTRLTIGIIVLTIFLIVGFFLYVPYYYEENAIKADLVSDDFCYYGEQFVKNMSYDIDSEILTLAFEENNLDNIVPDTLKVSRMGYILEENYLVKDDLTGKYSFEYVIPTMLYKEPLDAFSTKGLTINRRIDTKDGGIYHLELNLYLDVNKDSGSFFRRFMIGFYQRCYASDYQVGITTDSYFVYENGCFRPLLLSDERIGEYVNAYWDGTDLNVVCYDEYGNEYLSGPVRTRDSIDL